MTPAEAQRRGETTLPLTPLFAVGQTVYGTDNAVTKESLSEIQEVTQSAVGEASHQFGVLDHRDAVVDALATAGLIGAVVAQRASLSGAVMLTSAWGS